jgi:hypothetical protein
MNFMHNYNLSIMIVFDYNYIILITSYLIRYDLLVIAFGYETMWLLFDPILWQLKTEHSYPVSIASFSILFDLNDKFA